MSKRPHAAMSGATRAEAAWGSETAIDKSDAASPAPHAKRARRGSHGLLGANHTAALPGAASSNLARASSDRSAPAAVELRSSAAVASASHHALLASTGSGTGAPNLAWGGAGVAAPARPLASGGSGVAAPGDATGSAAGARVASDAMPAISLKKVLSTCWDLAAGGVAWLESACSRRALARRMVVSPDTQVAQVVGAIRSGKVTQRADGHLVLPPGIDWPHGGNRVLFVRQCYAPLYEAVLGRCLPPAAKPSSWHPRHGRRVITGQPDTGKSLFGWYVMYRLLTEQPTRTVVYVYHGGAAFVISPSGPIHLSDSKRVKLLRPSDFGPCPLVIGDAHVPDFMHDCPALAILSPRTLAASDPSVMEAYHPGHIYMPLPTEDEVLAMREAAFPDLPLDGVQLRLQLWGPIPRHVLQNFESDAQDALWDWVAPTAREALNSLLQRNLGASGAFEHDHAHSLVHVRAAGQDATSGMSLADPAYYKPGRLVAASSAVARYLTDRLKAIIREQAGGDADCTAASTLLASLLVSARKQLSVAADAASSSTASSSSAAATGAAVDTGGD